LTANEIKSKLNYGPGDNMISELFEVHVEKDAIRVNTDEIDRVTYYSIEELENLLIQSEAIFSKWFKQLFLWYIGKQSEVQVINEYRKPGWDEGNGDESKAFE
jgi:isopentenyldiphosphate isomerase